MIKTLVNYIHYNVDELKIEVCHPYGRQSAFPKRKTLLRYARRKRQANNYAPPIIQKAEKYRTDVIPCQSSRSKT